jgi:hypothetical protein
VPPCTLGLALEPAPPVGRRCSERIGGFPKSRVLRDPGVRFGFGCKADCHLRLRAGLGHLHGKAVVFSIDDAITYIDHGCL